MTKQYIVVNGTSYDAATPKGVIETLERARRFNTRVRFFYGNADDATCWNEENDVTGYIGRTCGEIKCPILLANSKSTGGGIILTASVIAILGHGGNWHYKHRLFMPPVFNAVSLPAKGDARYLASDTFTQSLVDKGYRVEVLIKGAVQARFKGPRALEQSDRYIAFMQGERMTK